MNNLGLSKFPVDVTKVKDFDAVPRPRGASQEFETRLHARVAFEAIDVNLARKEIPTVLVHENGEQFFERYAVERIFGLSHANRDPRPEPAAKQGKIGRLWYSLRKSTR